MCPCMCVAASNLLISKSSLESSYHCVTHTDHQHLICHRGGRFGCLAEKPKDNAKKTLLNILPQLTGGKALFREAVSGNGCKKIRNAEKKQK